MATPSVNEVCGRCCRSPITCLSIFTLIIGLLGTFTTLAIGYYFVYSEEANLGICFITEYPGIRRACLLDLTGGVMSILVSVLILMMELFSAYLNKNDWKIMFSIINISLALLTATVLLAGAIQGAVDYSRYCHSHGSLSYHDWFIGLGYTKRCDFEQARDEYNADVDFVAVLVLSGIGAFFWIFVLLVEVIRACILCMQAQIPVGLSVRADAYRPVPTEMDEMPAPPPNYSEM